MLPLLGCFGSNDSVSTPQVQQRRFHNRRECLESMTKIEREA